MPVPDRPQNGVIVKPAEVPGCTVGLSVLCANPATSQTVLATNSTAPDAAKAYATVLSVLCKLRSLAYCVQLAANEGVVAGHAPLACTMFDRVTSALVCASDSDFSPT